MVALDYDGTLAPIVARPELAEPEVGAVAALTHLAARTRVALLTGRPAQQVVDLAGLAQVPGLIVLGQYGAERWEAGRLTTSPALSGVRALREQLPPLVGAAELEDKGSALVVHTRNTPDPVGEQQRLLAPLTALASSAGLE
ncbi:MAG TPA: trehalose-phosphatase, partial [Mycobacteriales bacterium]|nr:trehalose-phosphatase [Mycobacteriales bacterium]